MIRGIGFEQLLGRPERPRERSAWGVGTPRAPLGPGAARGTTRDLGDSPRKSRIASRAHYMITSVIKITYIQQSWKIVTIFGLFVWAVAWASR